MFKKTISIFITVCMVFTMLVSIPPLIASAGSNVMTTLYVSPTAIGGGNGTIGSPYTI